VKTVDISGFGSSYEAACQKMLLNGIRFLKDKPTFDWSGYKSYQNITGICIAENKDAKALDKAIYGELEDTTGAMHQAVVSHLAYIHKNGYDAWLKQAEGHGMRIYEISSEEALDKEILSAQTEWQRKLDGGYDPMEEVLKSIPKENIIHVDPTDPESINQLADRIAEIVKEG